jgi:DNA-binding XRE family transcriptional regulator
MKVLQYSTANGKAYKKVDLSKWADELGVDINEIDQKLRLRYMIINIRNKKNLSQAELADLVGVSRSRIAQIESGIKLHRTSFDIFLRILQGVGYRYRITTSKLAA